MNYTKAEVARSWAYLQAFRGCTVAAKVSSVARSGMSRRIQFYAVKDGDIESIGWQIAAILGLPCDINKGGIRVQGCGMDMRFHVLSNFNYDAATHDTGKSIIALLKTKECGERIYDNYFFDANRIREL